MGYEVDSLSCPDIEFGVLRKIVNFITRNLKRIIKLILALAGVKKYREKLKLIRNKKAETIRTQKANDARKAVFQKFYNEHFDRIIYTTYKKALSHETPHIDEYDYYVAGSDQIWNLSIVKTIEALRYYYLRFAAPDKRVNYASSFGVSKLNLLERCLHKKYLQGFRRLSSREEEGCEIIRQLTGRDAELVLDPTLLFRAEEWRKLEKKPPYPLPKHYVLMYFIEKNEECLREAYKLAGDTEVLNIRDMGFYHSQTGPCEFLYLIDHAECVLTSSFHGTAFSTNFGKKFVCFKSDTILTARISTASVFSRIRTLLSNVGLMNRIYASNRNVLDEPIDYDAVNEKLEALRASSMKYLSSCLRK